MPFTVLDHSLSQTLLSRLRDSQTPPERFRPLTRALTQILLVEATRRLPIDPRVIQTPLEDTEGAALQHEIVAVPILRAGLGMLDGVLEMLPEATVSVVVSVWDQGSVVTSTWWGCPAMST